MRERHIILNPYLDQDMINNIYQAVGVQVEEPSEGMTSKKRREGV